MTMAHEPLTVACIGMGWWSDVLADAIKRSGKLQIAACYSRSDENRQQSYRVWKSTLSRTPSWPNDVARRAHASPSSSRSWSSRVMWRNPPPKAPIFFESGYSQTSAGSMVLTDR